MRDLRAVAIFTAQHRVTLMAVSPVLSLSYLLQAGNPWSMPVTGRLLRRPLMRWPGHMRILQSRIF